MTDAVDDTVAWFGELDQLKQKIEVASGRELDVLAKPWGVIRSEGEADYTLRYRTRLAMKTATSDV